MSDPFLIYLIKPLKKIFWIKIALSNIATAFMEFSSINRIVLYIVKCLLFYILRIFCSHYTDRSKNHHTWQRFSKRRKNRSKGWTAIAWGGWASSCLCDSQQSRKCQEGCWKGHFILPFYFKYNERYTPTFQMYCTTIHEQSHTFTM